MSWQRPSFMPSQRLIRSSLFPAVLLLGVATYAYFFLTTRYGDGQLGFSPPSAPVAGAGHLVGTDVETKETTYTHLASKLNITIPDLSYVFRNKTNPSDILLIFKTGASTIWRRMPVQATTTLRTNAIPHRAVYSDLSENIDGGLLESIDILENVTSILQYQDPDAYETYLALQSPEHVNTYREHAGLPGDEPRDRSPSNPPGWQLDKYKFLPMLQHATDNWPGLPWYIYIEDDTYIFWENIQRWLDQLDPEEVAWYGAFSGEDGATFAQGGSGIVFSGGLMQEVFNGSNIPDLEKYGNYTADACCGDMILGHVLREAGVPVNKGNFGTLSFRPEPPWKTGFDESLWCSPVFTFHHLHQRDLVALSLAETTHQSKNKISHRPIIFRDIFKALILPHLNATRRGHWDNFATQYVLTNLTENLRPLPAEVLELDPSAFAGASESPKMCRKACLALPECMSWRHDTRAVTCSLDSALKLGREMDPLPPWEQTVVTSGWVRERMMVRLMGEKCKVVGNVTWM